MILCHLPNFIRKKLKNILKLQACTLKSWWNVSLIQIKKFLFLFFSVRGSRPGKNVQLTEGEIRGLCLKSREIFLSQPILLELEAPLKICGKK